jgi:hypothetical protein
MASRRPAVPDEAWDAAWAEYDGRHPPPAARSLPAAAPAGTARGAPSAAARPGRGRRWMRRLSTLGVATALLAWLTLPVGIAREVMAAVDSRDAASLAARIDWRSAGPALAGSLAEIAAEGGQGLGPAAQRFLTGMAAEMARTVETRPAALAGLVIARSEGEGGRAALRWNWAGGPALLRLEVGRAEPAGGVSLAIAPATPLRWQVVALDFARD